MPSSDDQALHFNSNCSAFLLLRIWWLLLSEKTNEHSLAVVQPIAQPDWRIHRMLPTFHGNTAGNQGFKDSRIAASMGRLHGSTEPRMNEI
jgi:hypothetical protein